MMRFISLFLAAGLSIPMSPGKFRNAKFMGFPDIGAEEPILIACKVIKIVFFHS